MSDGATLVPHYYQKNTDTLTTANADATPVKCKTILGESVEKAGTIVVNSLTSKMGKVCVTCPLISDVTRKVSDR